MLVVPRRKVAVRLVPRVWAPVGGLQRVRVDDAHIAEHDPPRRLLGPGEGEATVLKVEAILGILVEEEREDLLPQILLAPLPVLAAVHEHVVLAGVGVEVAVEEDGALLQDLGH